MTVGVVGRYPGTVAQIAAQVREAVGTVAPGAAVTVGVEDIDIAIEPPDGDREEVAPSAGPGRRRRARPRERGVG